MSCAINLNRRGLTSPERVEDNIEQEEAQDTLGFFDTLDLMDFKDDLTYK